MLRRNSAGAPSAKANRRLQKHAHDGPDDVDYRRPDARALTVRDNPRGHIPAASRGPNPSRSLRLSRVDVDADDAVLQSRTLLGGSAEALESVANSHLIEASRAQDVDELCTRQSAGNSTGPEMDIFAQGLVEFLAQNDVAVKKLAAGLQYAEDLAKSHLLVGCEIQHAVRNDDIDAPGVDRQRQGIAQSDLDVAKAQSARAVSSTLGHRLSHVHTNGSAHRPYGCRSEEEVHPGAAANVDNRGAGGYRLDPVRIGHAGE